MQRNHFETTSKLFDALNEASINTPLLPPEFTLSREKKLGQALRLHNELLVSIFTNSMTFGSAPVVQQQTLTIFLDLKAKEAWRWDAKQLDQYIQSLDPYYASLKTLFDQHLIDEYLRVSGLSSVEEIKKQIINDNIFIAEKFIGIDEGIRKLYLKNWQIFFKFL